MRTDQEAYWLHNDAYHARSPGDEASNYEFFRKALRCADLRFNCSILEFGCGTGANLRSLKRCFTSPQLTGIELNRDAAEKANADAEVHCASILEGLPNAAYFARDYDLVFTKGLLIHIAPADLPKAYQALVDASDRYVLVCEYFSPQPRNIPYRGTTHVLWARDFAGEIIDAHGLKLVDYGFVSKRDIYPQDDLTWWLLEKP